MRHARWALLFAVVAAACSDDKSVVVVSVYSNGLPVARVAQLRVEAINGQSGEYTQELYYPEKPRAEDALFELSDKPVTFSISFRTMFKGTVTFKVEALDPANGVVASGESSPEQLNVGQVTYSTVWVSPACDPMQPIATCGERKNCAFVCDEQKQAKTVCMAAGVKQTGDACDSLSDCAPGSECFTFTCSGISIKTCRKFCASDTDCGVGSTCSLSITCSASNREALICSRPCDPTGDASDGCTPGLSCFIYAGEVTDCACKPASRTGVTDQACTGDDGCLPGLTCVDRGGQKTCRPLCVLGKTEKPVCPPGSTCTEVTSSVYKTYGACL
jgi:hypothetical protein